MKAVAETKNGQSSEVAERSFVSPEVNIYETAEGFVLQAEMPGVPKNGIEVTLQANTLILTGRRTEETVPDTALIRESRGADYRRVFELDPAIDAQNITAEMRQGVLALTLPKAEREKPRKIQVK